MTCGIYKIRNIVNGKVIIGSSINIPYRWSAYKCWLRKNKYENQYLQNSWNKYGEQNFEFSVIEECPENQLLIREDFWISQYDSMNRDKGYNLQSANRNTGYSYKGWKHTEESLEKMRISHLGKKHTMETIEKMKLDGRRGRKLSDESRMKLSLSCKGHHRGKGIPKTEEHKRKQSMIMKELYKTRTVWNKGIKLGV